MTRKKKSWIYRLLDKRKQKVYIAKEFSKDKTKMPKNIYEGTTFQTHLSQFNFIHYTWKEGFLVPLTLFLDKWFGNRLLKKTPPAYYNKNFEIFEKTFEKSIHDWSYRFCAGNNQKKIMKVPQNIKTGRSQRCLRTLMRMVLTIAFYDTAYREFLNIFFHNQALGMLDYYKGREWKHILYVDKNVYDIKYFVAWKMNELMMARTPEELTQAQNTLPDGMHIGKINDATGEVTEVHTGSKNVDKEELKKALSKEVQKNKEKKQEGEKI